VKKRFLFLLTASVIVTLPSFGQALASGSAELNLPGASVGTTYRVSLLDQFSLPGLSASSFSAYSVQLTGGTLPAGLELQGNGVLAGTPVAADTFVFSCLLTRVAGSGSAAAGESYAIQSTLRVQPAAGPQVVLEPAGLQFDATAGASALQTKLLILTNHGTGSRTFTSQVIGTGTDWISVSSGKTLPGAGAATVAITADGGRLLPGSYRAKVRICFDDDGSCVESTVTLAKSSDPQAIVVAKTGIAFQAVAGGSSVSQQDFYIQAGGNADLNWNALIADQMDGSKWLSVAPGNGLTSGTAGSVSTALVDASTLATGDYFQGIMITADNVSNSPQGVTVMLRVLPQDQDVVPTAAPTGLILTARAGDVDPEPQEITLTNIAARSYSFTVTAQADDGGTWLQTAATSGSVPLRQSAKLQVRASIAGLPAGSYQGKLNLWFPELNSLQTLSVSLVVTAGSGISAMSRTTPKAAGCTAQKVVLVSTQLSSGFRASTGWPSIIDVQAMDDCGVPMTTGAVSASFSDNEPPLSLQPVGNGRWVVTWAPKNPAAQSVVITVRAYRTDLNIEGTTQIGGSVQAGRTTPTISAIGVGSPDNLRQRSTFAPGSMITITGSGLTDSAPSTAAPCQTMLGGSRVLLKSVEVPLCLAGPDEIRFVVPSDVPENTTQQLIVRNGDSVSVPTSITIVPPDDGDPAQTDGVRNSR
jgi:hypothetical protein